MTIFHLRGGKWWWSVLMPLSMIIVVALLAYSNTWQVPFVYDDLGNIVGNVALENFNLLDLKNYTGLRSLPQATLAANVQLGGTDSVWHFHAVNLAIHVVNGLLVFWLSLLLFRRFTPHATSPPPSPHLRRGNVVTTPTPQESPPSGGATYGVLPTVFALFAALIFVAHPIAIEAVTYVVQRTVSLAVLFYLLALVGYAEWRRASLAPGVFSARHLGWAGLSLIATVLAMHSKQIALTIPLAIVWIELCFFSSQRSPRSLWPMVRRLVLLSPWLLMLLYMPWRMYGFDFPTNLAEAVPGDVTGSVNEVQVAAAGQVSLSRTTYLLTQFGVLLTYLRLLIFPVGQSIDHDFTVYDSLLSVPPLIGLAILLIIVGLIFWFWPRRRVASFGLGFFLLAMVMESGALPLLEVVAEYRLYLPLVGFALVAADVLLWLYTKIPPNPLLPREALNRAGWAALLLIAVIILPLTLLTYRRNSVWQDSVLLWQDAIAKAPDKARPRNNLGTLLLEQRKYREASAEFQRAVEIKPTYAYAYNNLGTAQAKLGNIRAAARHYQKATELDPSIVPSAINLGIVYLQLGKLDEAAEQLELTTRRAPRSARAHTVLGVIYIQLSRRPGNRDRLLEAREQFEAALAIDPDDTSARNNLELVQGLQPVD